MIIIVIVVIVKHLNEKKTCYLKKESKLFIESKYLTKIQAIRIIL